MLISPLPEAWLWPSDPDEVYEVQVNASILSFMGKTLPQHFCIPYLSVGFPQENTNKDKYLNEERKSDHTRPLGPETYRPTLMREDLLVRIINRNTAKQRASHNVLPSESGLARVAESLAAPKRVPFSEKCTYYPPRPRVPL